MSQMNQQPVYVTDMIGEAAAAVDTALFVPGVFPHVNFIHGHPLEIIADLQEKLQIDAIKAERFPLIMLFHDFEIVRDSNVMYGTATVNMAVATLTQPNYTSEQRYANTFKPILYPIYYELLKQIGKSGYFSNAMALVNHTQIDRVYWGRTGLYGNVGNQFNDYLDCIEMRGMRLTVKNPNCKPFKS